VASRPGTVKSITFFAMWAERKGRRCRYEGAERRERGAILRVNRRRRRCWKGGLKEEGGCDKGDNVKRVQEGAVRGG
jgi:hypothetical protein